MELFGIKLYSESNFYELIFRLGLNTFFIILLIGILYYSRTKRKEYVFTYYIFSFVVFLLCYMLNNVKLELGFALGLFAIFGVIRYRTTQIEIKEMTYLFLVIGISVVNALANEKVSYAELIFTNLSLLTVTFLMERVFFKRHETCKQIDYEKIELIKPQHRQLLIDDLEERTGLKINRVEVGKISFIRDSARLFVYYYEENNMVNSANSETDYAQDSDD